MIARLTGVLERVGEIEATVSTGGGIAYQVLLPAYAVDRLRDSTGQRVTLTTIEYLEPQGPGGSLIPRLVGFPSPEDRRFFELLTSVDGIGNRKALRAMVEAPGEIARAIADRDVTWLQKLPEVGRRTAEKIVAELHGRIDAFVTESAAVEVKGAAPMGSVAEEAVRTLVALGEPRAEAELMVRAAMRAKNAPDSVEAIVSAAYAARS